MLLPPARAFIESCELPPAPGLLARFEALRGRPYPWLLDSSLPSARLGRWSFAGAEPYAVLRVRGERCELECRRAVRRGLRVGRRSLRADPLELLRALAPPPPDGARRAGAAVRRRRGGLFRLRAGRALRGAPAARRGRPRPARRRPAARRPRARARPRERRQLRARPRLRRRRWRPRARTPRRPRASWSRASARNGCARRASERPARAPDSRAARASRRAAPASAGLDEAGYAKAIERTLEEIAAGNLYQACLTRRLERDFGGDAWALHLALRRRNPAPFACFFELPEAAIVGSSPERFLAVDARGPRREPADQGHAAPRRRPGRATRASGARCSRPRRTAPRT